MTKLLSLLLACSSAIASDYVLPTFPGAVGWGMATTGGRGGQVRYVDKLTDDGSEGTLRWALQVDGHNPKIVIVRTNGVIPLQSQLYLRNNTTLVGHKAVGGGVVVTRYPMSAYSHVSTAQRCTSNIVIYGMRFALGSDAVGYKEESAINIGSTSSKAYITNVIVASSSVRWGMDQTLNMTAQYGTVQDCIIAEPLAEMNYPSIHHYIGFFNGTVSVLRNMAINFDGRWPKMDGSSWIGGPVDFRNNVSFNGFSDAMLGGYGNESPVWANIMSNYYARGAAAAQFLPARSNIVFTYNMSYTTTNGLYVSGNYLLNAANNFNTDNANGILSTVVSGVIPNESDTLTNIAYTAAYPGQSMTALESLAFVTNYAGAFPRDSHDLRYIAELHGQTPDADTYYGWATTEGDVGGNATYSGGTPYTDTDADGMPDDWERQYFDGTLARTGNMDADGDGYTDLEEYLWGTNPMVYVDYYRDFYTGALRSDGDPIPDPDDPPVEGTRATITGRAVIGGRVR